MNQTLLYRLEPRSPFHFGERGVGIEATEEILHSDTLFSALCCVIAETQPRETFEKFLDPFKKGEPPFLFTSAFPYASNVFFFPKPMLRPKLKEVPQRYKDIRFLSLKIWEAFIKGETLTFSEDNLLNQGTVWISDLEKQSLLSSLNKKVDELWKKSVVPRVIIDRKSSVSMIYHVGRQTFAQDCGLYFLCKFYDDSFRTLLEDTLQYLSDTGLGGERSNGYGQFKLLQPQPFTLPEGETNYFLTLSLYNPTREELSAGLLNHLVSYEIIERRGWIYSPFYRGKYRKSMRMFAEGSVLCGSPHQKYGQLVNVTPEIEPAPHPIYRYGFAFPIPVTVEEDR